MGDSIKKVYEYGALVKDIVTGYEGKVTAFCHYYGRQERQYLVEGIDATGRPIEEWVKESRMVKMEED